MKKVRIIARLDAKPPYVVKPIHFEGLRKVGTPKELAVKYYEQGADEICYIDAVASLYRRKILYQCIEETAKNILVPFCVGGGVKSVDDFSKLFHHGADKVAINTYAVQEDPSIIDEAAKIFGSQAVVVHIEAKRRDGWWECYTDCGRERSGKDALQWAREVEDRGAGELLISSVDKDGFGRGFDIELIGKIVSKANIPIIAGSGAGKVEDIKSLVKQANPDAVTIATLLHYDIATIADIKKALEGDGVDSFEEDAVSSL